MHKRFNPTTVAPPLGKYSHAIEVPANARWLHISGQLGVMPDGRCAEGIEQQTEWAWKNLLAILADADMAVEDIVKVTTFITRAEDVATVRQGREQFLGEAKPASTLLVISALAGPAFLIEIELIAAKS